MKGQMVYKSIFKNKGKNLQESKAQKLFKIREQLNTLKKKLREEDEEILGTEDEANPEGIASIIDKVEDLVVDAIQTLGATDPVTAELIDTVDTLEVAQDEEALMAEIEASAQEAEEIQEDFEPVYDSMGNVVNYAPEDDFIDDDVYEDEVFIDETDIYDDGMGDEFIDDEFMDDDDLGYYEKYDRKAKKVKRFKK